MMALRQIPSRRMHERHLEQESPAGHRSPGQLLAASMALAGLSYGVIRVVDEFGIGLLLIGVGVVAAYVIGRLFVVERRLQAMAAQRQGESICTFVRAFDCRSFDTWVLRAAYEQLNKHAGIPVRPSDRLAEDLGIDDAYDLDGLGETIARLAGREFDETRNNPWFGQVRTVADVCDFLMCQPRVSAITA